VFLELNALAPAPIGSDVLLPGGAAQLRVQLKNSGGATAAAVRATLTSSSPLVRVTAAAATYPTVFAGATATNPAPFAFTVSPTAPCGARLPFRLELEYTGRGTHPVVLAFDLQTGRPAGASETTPYMGPAVEIPDGDPAGVEIPLAIATPGPLAELTFHLDGTACTTDAGATTVGIDHTWVGDVALRLTSPAGTTVTLLDAAGGPLNSGHNFCQVVLGDAAAGSIQDITRVQAPFKGAYRPLRPLAAFIGDETGGTWKLHASDSTPLDVGHVRAFSIETRGFTCTP
jgi:subtilisin-like proprotein convertase family protein